MSKEFESKEDFIMMKVKNKKYLLYIPYESTLITCGYCEQSYIIFAVHGETSMPQGDVYYCPFCGEKSEGIDKE